MRRFNKPPVGSHITVTTQYRNILLESKVEWQTNTYSADVLKPEKWFGPNDFKISSDDERMPFRVINLNHVVDMKIGDEDGDQSERNGTRVVAVKGSKGAEYSVTIKDGTAISCDCSGFQFRNHCRHLKEAMGDVDSSPEDKDAAGAKTRPKRSATNRGNKMSKSKSLGWNDRLALINHFKPTDKQACSTFGVSQEELNTARDLMAAGTFRPTPDIDFKSYESMFASDSTTSTKTEKKSGATSTKKPDGGDNKPVTATKKTKEPKKRGRKGDKIANAFAAIPTTPTPAEDFAQKHGVSLAVLRQSKRFDKHPDLGNVKVKKDKETKQLMISRVKDNS